MLDKNCKLCYNFTKFKDCFATDGLCGIDRKGAKNLIIVDRLGNLIFIG